MAKKLSESRRAKRQEGRGTNWYIIGGIGVLAVVALFVLLFTDLRSQNTVDPTPTPPTAQPLAEYCQENPDRCVTNGSPDAPVTIVEISDYGCGHCANFNRDTAGLIEDLYVSQDQVQWVVLPYALSEQTLPAAAASMCAADQDRFFEFHKLLFQMQGQPQALTAAGSQQAAEELGLDLDVFNRCLADAKYVETVRQNIAAASAIGVAATPTFFINDQILEGNRPLTTFQGQISAIIGGANES